MRELAGVAAQSRSSACVRELEGVAAQSRSCVPGGPLLNRFALATLVSPTACNSKNSGGQDYFTHSASKTAPSFDFHIDNGVNCSANCSVADWDSSGVYSAHVYAASASAKLREHAERHPDDSKPFFMYLAFQSVHSPAQVPDEYVPSPCPFNTSERCTFAGMVRALDEAVGNVTAALRDAGLADSTLVVFVSDNGGPISTDGGGDFIGSSNYPLRGSKHSLWEGGVRVTAVVSGPLVDPTPAGGPGGNLTGLVHHTDWLPTFIEAAGVDYTPAPGFELHGVSAWGMLTRGEPSARNEVLLNIDPCQPAVDSNYPVNASKQGNAAIRVGDWKLTVGMIGPPWDWSGPEQVFAEVAPTDAAAPGGSERRLGPVNGIPNACGQHLWPLPNMTTQLFNIATDPWEREDVSSQHPDVVQTLLARVAYWATTVQVAPYWATAKIDPNFNPAKTNGTYIPWLPNPPSAA